MNLAVHNQSWNCMRGHDLWKKSIEVKIREEIVIATEFCWNLFGT